MNNYKLLKSDFITQLSHLQKMSHVILFLAEADDQNVFRSVQWCLPVPVTVTVVCLCCRLPLAVEHSSLDEFSPHQMDLPA